MLCYSWYGLVVYVIHIAGYELVCHLQPPFTARHRPRIPRWYFTHFTVIPIDQFFDTIGSNQQKRWFEHYETCMNDWIFFVAIFVCTLFGITNCNLPSFPMKTNSPFLEEMPHTGQAVPTAVWRQVWTTASTRRSVCSRSPTNRPTWPKVLKWPGPSEGSSWWWTSG